MFWWDAGQAVASSILDPLGQCVAVARFLSAKSVPKAEMSLTHSEAPRGVFALLKLKILHFYLITVETKVLVFVFLPYICKIENFRETKFPEFS